MITIQDYIDEIKNLKQQRIGLTKVIAELQTKIHRRNVQIQDLKDKSNAYLSFTTVSDLFFNSNEADRINWESEENVKKEVIKQTSLWLQMYPEMNRFTTAEVLTEDFLRRV